MRNLNEGKKKSPSYMAELSEIDKQSAIVAMEAKINKLAEMADKKKERLNMVSEDENLSELIDKKRVKMMEREIKEIEKAKLKLEKLYEKACGSKPKEIVDEDARTDAEEEGYLDGMKDEKEDMEEGYSTPSYEEDDTDPMTEELNLNPYSKFKTMKPQLNEEFLRMQKLAGIITEGEYKKRLNEAANTDLELKSFSKKLYSYAKKKGAQAFLVDFTKMSPKTLGGKVPDNNKPSVFIQISNGQVAVKMVGNGVDQLYKDMVNSYPNFEFGEYKYSDKQAFPPYEGVIPMVTFIVKPKSTGKKGGVMATESFLNEAAGENLELKNLAKQLYLGFKRMGAGVSLIDYQKVKQIGKKDGLSYDNKDVLITVGKDGTGNDLVVVVLIGDKALGFEDKIKKDFKQFEFVDGVSGDSASWKKLDVKTKELLIKPGKTTSE